MVNLTGLAQSDADFLRNFEFVPLAWDGGVLFILSLSFLISMLVGVVSKSMALKPKRVVFEETIEKRNSARRNSATIQFQKKQEKSQHFLLLLLVAGFLLVLLVDIGSEVTFIVAFAYLGYATLMEEIVYTASLVSMAVFFIWSSALLLVWFLLGNYLFFQRTTAQQDFKVRHLSSMTFHEAVGDYLWQTKEKLKNPQGLVARVVVAILIISLPVVLVCGWCVPLIVLRWIFGDEYLDKMIFYQNDIFIFIYQLVMLLYAILMMAISAYFLYLNSVVAKDNKELSKMFAQANLIDVGNNVVVLLPTEYPLPQDKLDHIRPAIREMTIPVMLPNSFSNGVFKRLTVLLWATSVAIVVRATGYFLILLPVHYLAQLFIIRFAPMFLVSVVCFVVCLPCYAFPNIYFRKYSANLSFQNS